MNKKSNFRLVSCDTCNIMREFDIGNISSDQEQTTLDTMLLDEGWGVYKNTPGYEDEYVCPFCIEEDIKKNKTKPVKEVAWTDNSK